MIEKRLEWTHDDMTYDVGQSILAESFGTIADSMSILTKGFLVEQQIQ